MIHGHQVLPWGDQEALSNVQRELGCDILLSAHTHQIEVRAKEGKFFINPGSISGAFSYSMPDPTPSFVNQDVPQPQSTEQPPQTTDQPQEGTPVEGQ